MKRNTRDRVLLALAIVCTVNSIPAQAAAGGKPAFVPSNAAQPASDRLIVKLRVAKTAQLMSVSQIRTELSKPYSVQVLQQLQAAAGVAMSDLHATGNGAHVMALHGVQNRQTVAQAIAGISRLPDVEYVEEDSIETIRMLPNDTYYTNGPTAGYPGLWGMWPVTVAASSPASLGTGSYGADFETAWNSFTGTGAVVAVVDTGITPHLDIVGASGVVAAGAGSNLVSNGYDFITDCRVRGTTALGGCPAATPTASAYIAPQADATDTGDYITSQDTIDNPTLFPAVSNSSWHGTHVAGTIAAIGNNNTGVIGGAYGAKILPVRALGKGGGYSSDVSEAIMWAAGAHPTINNPNPAKVINLSLGSTSACSVTRQNAINAAVAKGAVVVVAAGNENQDVANSSAANCQNVISVAAIARDGSRASYSNFSSPASNITNPTNVTLAAPGGDAYGGYPANFEPGILSTVDTGPTTPQGSGYAYYNGTSMATPHVSAAVALMLARNPALTQTPAQVRTILSAPSSLTAFPSFGANSATWDCALNKNCGAGILNANLAVQNSAPAALTAAATTDFGAASVNTAVSKTVTLTNGSGASVTTGTATVTGNNTAFFSITADTCSTKVIAPAAVCQVTIRYAPTAAGSHTATLTVPDTTSPATTLRTFVALTGAAGSQLTTTTPSVTAATVTVGQSTTVSLSYKNPNWIALPVGAVILSQPSIMAASADGCSNTTLAAGASCAVMVTITPAAGGSYSGTAALGVSGGGTPAVATISGTATTPPSSGGGGCSVMPVGANPDASLLLAMLAVAGYWLRRRVVRERRAD